MGDVSVSKRSSDGQVMIAIRTAIRQRKFGLALRVAIVGAKLAFWTSLAKFYRLFFKPRPVLPELLPELPPEPQAAVTVTETAACEASTAGVTERDIMTPERELQRFIGMFGVERGASYFAEGLAYFEAFEREIERLEDEKLVLDKQAESVRNKLRAVGIKE